MAFDMFSTPPAPIMDAVAAIYADAYKPVEPPPADIFTRATVLHLQFRRLGTTRRIQTTSVASAETQAQSDVDLLRVTAATIDSKELEAIAKHDRETDAEIAKYKAGPAFANTGGFHLVPNTLRPRVDDWLARRLPERQALVEQFLTVLPARIADTQARLGPLSSQVRYPTADEARNAFACTARYMTFGYTDEAAARAWQADALNDCRQALRAGFRDLVDHLADRLAPGPDGKQKVFRDSVVENFELFAENFAARNIADDQVLADLVKQARAILSGRDASDLRGAKNADLREDIAERLAAVKAAIDPLVTDKPSRRYAADDE